MSVLKPTSALGPGQFDLAGDLSTEARGNVAFGCSSTPATQAFTPRVSVPGPGAYELQEAPNQIGFGWSAASGTHRMSVLKPTSALGPGQFDLAGDLSQEARGHVAYEKSAVPATDVFSPRLTSPGPAAYSTPEISSRGIAGFGAMSESTHRWSVTGNATPGPGDYNLAGDLSKDARLAVSYDKSASPRTVFASRQVSVPGPGAYDVEESTKQIGFGWDAASATHRMAVIKPTSAQGPGQFELAGDMSKEARGNVAYGKSAVPATLVLSPRSPVPGPGAYFQQHLQTTAVPQPTAHVAIAKESTHRTSMPMATIPAPGQYTPRTPGVGIGHEARGYVTYGRSFVPATGVFRPRLTGPGPAGYELNAITDSFGNYSIGNQ